MTDGTWCFEVTPLRRAYLHARGTGPLHQPAKMTPSERAQWAALNRWAKEDPTANAERGQAGLRAKMVRLVDEHAAEAGEQLTETERQRRADVRYAVGGQQVSYLRERVGSFVASFRVAHRDAADSGRAYPVVAVEPHPSRVRKRPAPVKDRPLFRRLWLVTS